MLQKEVELKGIAKRFGKEFHSSEVQEQVYLIQKENQQISPPEMLTW